MRGRAWLLALLLAALGVFDAEEAVGGDLPRHVPETSICAPVNSRVWKLWLPDGSKQVFLRDADDPAILHGTGGTPWVGVMRPERNLVNFLSRRERGGDGTELGYVGGRLRFRESGGVQQEFTPESAGGAPEELWPKKPDSASRDAADIWRDGRRLRFLSRNPNRSALLLVQLALVALGVCLGRRGKWRRLAGGMVLVAALGLLAMTESRGGMVALAVAGGVEIVWRFRERLKMRRLGGLLLALAVLGTVAVCMGGGRQWLSRLQERDPSVENRLRIWREFPRMFVTAPLGWGWGRSGYAYNDWFEPMERHHATGDLFNDHLSRLAEFGVLGGWVYLFLWSSVIAVSLASAARGRSPVPAAVWTSFAVAGCFNPVQVWWWSWIVPVLTLMDLRKTGVKPWLASAAFSLSVVGAAWATGKCMGGGELPLTVAGGGSRICVNGAEPRWWVVDDGTVFDGEYPGFFGKELRARYRLHPETPPVGIVREVGALPRRMQALVVAGKRAKDFLDMPEWPEVQRVVLLSPPFGPQRVPAALRRHCEVRLIAGEFLAERLELSGGVPDWMAVVSGAELYIPGWWQCSFGELPK